jgi:Tfp pilus assembly protein PilN
LFLLKAEGISKEPFLSGTKARVMSHWHWKKIIQQWRGDAQSLGCCWDQSRLTMVHIRKYFRGLDIPHLISWSIPESGLSGLAPNIGQIVAENGLEGLPVALTINHGPGFIKKIKLPLAASENLAQVISYELDRFIPLDPEQVWISFQVAQKTETEVHLNLFAVHKKPVEECLGLLRAIGLKPISVELAPVSNANAFALLGGRLPVSWLLLDLLGETTELYHIKKDKLGPCLIKAHHPKKDIISDVWHTIEAIRETGSSVGVVCLAGENLAPEIIEEFSRAGGFSIIHSKDLLAKKLGRDLPSHASAWPALGAALQGVGKVPMSCNLLPAEDRFVIPLSNLFLIRILLATLLGLCVIWVGSIYFHKRVALFQVDRKIESLNLEVEKVKHQNAEAQAISRQFRDLWGGKGPAASKLQILALVTRTIPDHTWLYSLRLNPKSLEISGMSRSAADLIQLLDKSGLFSKTQFSSPIVSDASGNENFTIQAEFKELD